jgi:hypothetical protein
MTYGLIDSFLLPIFAQDAQDLLRSAQRSHSLGVLLAQAGVLIMAVAFVSGAYSTVRKGFVITKTKRIEGVPAKVLGAIFLAIAMGMAVFAIVFLPRMAF